MFNIDNIIEYCFIKTLSEEWPKNIHERTFVSRMAHYLANEIEKTYNSIKVDVEYNRIMNDVKRVDDLNRYVDLIIHERKTNNNYVAIEFKKNDNIDDDMQKLISLKRELNYRNIYCIAINEKSIYKYDGLNKEWNILPLNSDKYE